MRRLVLFIALLAPSPLLAQTVTHPLDGLATAEYWIVYDALQSAGHLTPETKFTSVLLRPPAKATVLAWTPGQPVPREADIVLLRESRTYTAAYRAIANTDIVGWYTLGFHHITRAEDWPVMPTMWHEFAIRPFHFFKKNPVLDLPKSLAGQ